MKTIKLKLTNEQAETFSQLMYWSQLPDHNKPKNFAEVARVVFPQVNKKVPLFLFKQEPGLSENPENNSR